MRRLLLALALLALSPATASAQEWNLDMVRAAEAQQRTAGAGVRIAIVDSGVDGAHPAFGGRAVIADPDGNGHGTHVAGIAGGSGVGVASGATLLGIRVLDDTGSGTDADVAAGIDRARENGAAVINLSLGSEIPIVGALDSGPVRDAMARALDAGIVVVAAAGNNAAPLCEQPDERLLCIGAVNRAGTRASYSSFGAEVDLYAPGGEPLIAGEGVRSSMPGGGYDEMAGTSQAAPHVAGAAAMLIACGVPRNEVPGRLISTAVPRGGFPVLDAAAAVATCPATQQQGGASGSGGAGGSGSGGSGAGGSGGAGGGAGGSGGGGGFGGGATYEQWGGAATVDIKGSQKRRTVLRRGVSVRVRDVLATGTAVLTLERNGRAIGRLRKRLVKGRSYTLRVKLSARGRKAVRRTRNMRVELLLRLPGEEDQHIKVLRIKR